MAGPAAVAAEVWDKATGFLHSQVNGKNWENNCKIAKALGIFAGCLDPSYSCAPVVI